MRSKVIVAGIAIVFAGVAWWIWRPGAGNQPSQAESSAASSSQPAEAARVAQPIVESSNTFARLLAGTSDVATLSVDQRRTRARGLFDAVRSINAQVPRDTFDVDAVVATVGRDPGTLHQWVRSHTRWVPYRGALRGAQGTLMDRTGNSLDRSLLLARLLRASGVPARLARAPLSAAQVARVQPSVQTPAPAAPAGSLELNDAIGTAFDAYAKHAGLDAAPIRQQWQQTEALSLRTTADMKRRVAAQTVRLVQDLDLASSVATDAPARDLAALQDHWWVQAQTGGTWTDLDPALPEAGARIVAAQDTVDPEAIPADLHHTVQVRVIVEQWDGTVFHERRAVSIDLRPSEVLGETLQLQHLPMAWPMDQIATPTADPQRRLKDTALAQQEWLPLFTLGAKRVSQASVLATGDLNATPGTKKRGPSGGFVDLLGGGSDQATSAPEGVLTAEWIEYEIRAPGHAPRIVRREVFDLVGGTARTARQGPPALTDPLRLRRALSMLTETEILLLSCQPSAAYLMHLTGSRLLMNEPLLTSLIAAEPLSGGQAPDRLRGAKRMPGWLYALAMARTGWSRGPGTVHIDQPNLLSQHTFLRQDATGAIAMARAFDIVANEVAGRGTPAEEFRARVEQGVLDANAESALIGPGANDGTTADRYEMETAPRWMPVRKVENLESLAPPPDVRARLEADLRAGFVLLVPPTSPGIPATWWRVDPKTGDTLSLGDRGWGQATLEYNMVMTYGTVLSGCALGVSLVNRFGPNDLVFCIGLATSALGFVAAGAPGMALYSYLLLVVGGLSLGTGGMANWLGL
jgi:transglutaminase-like putative cysteine protease